MWWFTGCKINSYLVSLSSHVCSGPQLPVWIHRLLHNHQLLSNVLLTHCDWLISSRLFREVMGVIGESNPKTNSQFPKKYTFAKSVQYLQGPSQVERAMLEDFLYGFCPRVQCTVQELSPVPCLWCTEWKVTKWIQQELEQKVKLENDTGELDVFFLFQ